MINGRSGGAGMSVCCVCVDKTFAQKSLFNNGSTTVRVIVGVERGKKTNFREREGKENN